MTPRVFVGSASEAEEIDLEVRSILEASGASVVGWRDLSRPGDFFLDALMGLGAAVDSALLIVTPDDLTSYRGTKRKSPRDNILLELGMLLSHFGKRRTGIVHVKSPTEAAALPSDLSGVTTLIFQSGSTEQNERQLLLWLQGVKEEMESEHPSLPRLYEMLRATFKSVPNSWREAIERYVVGSFMTTLKLASQGQIVLTPGQYYQAIYDELDEAAAPCEVLGVATLSSTFWSEDREQRTYVRKNAEAVRRGADIKRLFIVPDVEWNKLNRVVRQQLELGIHVRRAKPAILAEATRLEDMVMFVHRPSGSSRVYITDPAFDNPTAIRRARLILDAQDRSDLFEAFERVWSNAASVTVRDLATSVPPGKDERAPEPGPNMKVYALASPVVSCEEAAAAKGIPLDNELKTLILTTKRGYVALHILGNGEASLRAVKNAMDAREASLAPLAALSALGLQPGTVCAVKDPVWSLPHLITRRVFSKDMVSTNNGTHRGFYRFHPSVLLEADSVMVGDFERDLG
ncbi:MAG TPA: TIR domain-containing protein [Thermoanaerobaculia bacterium]|nr:TIR domain-containing protein [Thermoanaerobaculia bacterium]